MRKILINTCITLTLVLALFVGSAVIKYMTGYNVEQPFINCMFGMFLYDHVQRNSGVR